MCCSIWLWLVFSLRLPSALALSVEITLYVAMPDSNRSNLHFRHKSETYDISFSETMS